MIKVMFVLAALLPYVSLGARFPAEVQPWAAMLGLLLTMSWWLRQRSIRLRRVEFFAVLLAIGLAVYVGDGGVGTDRYLTKSAVYLISLSIYLGTRRLRRHHLMMGLSIAVAAYGFFGVLQLASPSLFVSGTSELVPVRDIVIGERGIASLTPEATDLGLTMVYMALIAFALLTTSDSKRETRRLRLVVCAAIVLIILSRSGSGIGGGLLVLIILIVPARVSALRRHRRRSPIRTALSATAIVIVIVAGVTLDVRGFRLVRDTMTSPSALFETSFVYRYVHNEVAIRSLFDSSGLGYGGGSFGTVAPRIFEESGFEERFTLTPYYAQTVPASLHDDPDGVLPQLLTEYGLLGVAFCVVLYRLGRGPSSHVRRAALVLLMLTWLQSFPPAYPPFWLLLALIGHPEILMPHGGDGRDENAQLEPTLASTREVATTWQQT